MLKIIVTVPVEHASKLREAMFDAGAGNLGNYSCCSFSQKGMGRFKPNENANPAIGEAGIYEEVEEEKIETNVPEANLSKVIEAIKKVHPYEYPGIDVYKLEKY